MAGIACASQLLGVDDFLATDMHQILTTARPAFVGCSTNSCARAIPSNGNRSAISRTRHPSFKCLVDGACGFKLGLRRYVIAADTENSGVDEDELPERNLRRGSIGGVSRDTPALRQHCNVDVDVRGESHFNNMINARRRQFSDSFHQGAIGQERSVRAGAQDDLLVGFRTASGDHSRSGAMRQLNGAGADRARSALHQDGPALDPRFRSDEFQRWVPSSYCVMPATFCSKAP